MSAELTLFRKELHVFRKHVALQLMVGLIGLFGILVSCSSSRNDPYLTILFSPGGDSEFQSYLMMTERDIRFPGLIQETDEPRGNRIHVTVPPKVEPGGHPVRARFNAENKIAGIAVRQILRTRLLEFLDVAIPVPIEIHDQNGRKLEVDIPAPPERKATDAKTMREVTMLLLATIAIMMCGLNIFSVIFSEEKGAKLLLAQLLSPVTLGSIIRAKMLFYLLLACSLEVFVIGLYKPRLLYDPAFWGIVTLGTVSYMSVASIIVIFSKKTSTANMVTMGYVLTVGLVVLLAQDLVLFERLKRILPEMYLFTALSELFDGRLRWYHLRNLVIASGTVFVLSMAAAKLRGVRGAGVG